jgi:hydroxymethylpyrimidine/phosphomethylpyrimidine kinase
MPPVVLSVNTSDPTGFGGLQADLKTFAAHRCHGATVATTLGGPGEPYSPPGNVVGGALSAVLAEFTPAATKVGAIGTAEIAAAVAGRARSGDLGGLVLDPVLDCGMGHRRGVISAFQRLMPFASVLTPDVDEASELVGWPVLSTADMAGAAAQLVSQGTRFVVITGGRLSGTESVDAVWTDSGVRFLHAPRIDVPGLRGAGSTFSAAVAARIALGAGPLEAVMGAKEYIGRALIGSRDWRLGRHGCPPDNLGFTAGTPSIPSARAPMDDRPPLEPRRRVPESSPDAPGGWFDVAPDPRGPGESPDHRGGSDDGRRAVGPGDSRAIEAA